MKIFQSEFFYFLSSENSLLKYKKFLNLGQESSISQNSRKTFLRENIRKFFRKFFLGKNLIFSVYETRALT